MKYYGLIIPPVFPTGVFIQDIRQTMKSDESEGVNTMTVTLTNQQKTHFNVKNGKQGSSAEVTAQMEQYAKNYIDHQLTEIQALVRTEIKTAVTTAENNLRVMIDSKFIEHYKRGYMQLPGTPSPREDASMYYRGYSWVKHSEKGSLVFWILVED